MGRAGLAGDEIGSSLIGSRIVRDMMRLAFYMEKKYPPYAKWLGTAFRELQSAEALLPLLSNAVHSTSWQQREESLSRGLERLVEIHNTLGITGELPIHTSAFWGRPFKVIGGERIAAAVGERIEDSHIRRLAAGRPIGSIDLFSDNTDMVGDTSLVPVLKRLF